jgi:hypothetical protein
MLRLRADAGAMFWESDGGSLRIEFPAPHLARVTFAGHLIDEFVEPIAAAAERLTQSGRPAVAFHDWEGMTNYDMSARLGMLGVAMRNHAKTARLHFLLGSTMVRLAVEVTNLVVGKFEVHPGRRSFEEAYARAIAEIAAAADGSRRLSRSPPG